MVALIREYLDFCGLEVYGNPTLINSDFPRDTPDHVVGSSPHRCSPRRPSSSTERTEWAGGRSPPSWACRTIALCRSDLYSTPYFPWLLHARTRRRLHRVLQGLLYLPRRPRQGPSTAQPACHGPNTPSRLPCTLPRKQETTRGITRIPARTEVDPEALPSTLASSFPTRQLGKQHKGKNEKVDPGAQPRTICRGHAERPVGSSPSESGAPTVAASPGRLPLSTSRR